MTRPSDPQDRITEYLDENSPCVSPCGEYGVRGPYGDNFLPFGGFTPEEKRRIADHMIAEWEKWANED